MRALLALVIAAALSSAKPAPSPAPTPQQKLYNNFFETMSKDREIQEAFKGLPPAQARLEAAGLAARGVARLDDATLLRRAQVMTVVLTQLSDLTCARIAKGKVSAPVLTEIQNVILTQDSATVAFWLDASKRAALAELHQTPAPLVAQEEVTEAYEEMTFGMSAKDKERMEAPWQPGSSNADAAWAIRTLYKRALTLPEPQRAVMMRAIATPN
jgi:hypothetical protein